MVMDRYGITTKLGYLIMQKKLVTILAIALISVPLAACSLNNNKQAAQDSSLKEQNSLLRENSRLKAKQSDPEVAEQNSSSTDSTNESYNQEDTTNSTVVHNKDEAIQLAESKYGDDNGDWEWTCLSSDHGYLSSDGYYFVKAISRSQIANGSMTGTAKSLEVYPDGTIIDN